MKSRDEMSVEELEQEIFKINDILENAGALNLSFVDQVGLSGDRDALRYKLQKLKTLAAARGLDLH